MTQLLQWTAIQVNRRAFLRRVLGGAFAAYAGVAVGAPSEAYAYVCEIPCHGPNGRDRCNVYVPGTCLGAQCASVYGVSCTGVTGWCGTYSCWTAPGHTCCDCQCGDLYGRTWYCYCGS